MQKTLADTNPDCHFRVAYPSPCQAFDKPWRTCAILVEVSRAAFCSRATIAPMGSPAGGRPRGSDGYDAVQGMG